MRLSLSPYLRGRRLALAVLLVAAALGSISCSSKTGPPEPETLEIGTVLLEGNLVRWATSDEARSSVRYGFEAGTYTHIAYPAAAQRADLAYLTQHAVPLLDLREGETVWLQTLNELPSGTVVASDERAFVASVGTTPRQLTSSMVHIGWGDAHLITMPTSGKRVLMDAGETGAAQAVAGWFAQKGVDDLDAVVVSHVHADHIGGMVGVDSNDDGDYEVPGILASFDPETYVDSPSKVHYRSLYAEVTSLMTKLGVERVVVERGDDNESFPEFASWDPAVRVLCLNSGLADDVPVGGFEGTNINNESICLRFSYGDVDFIVGGDTEVESESSIVDHFGAAVLDAEYYKSHHHGRFDGGSEKFLRAIRPRITLVPVSWKEYRGGWSEYVDESQPQFDRLARFRVNRFGIDDLPLFDRRQTASNQNITFATDGVSYEVRIEQALQPAKAFDPHAHDDCDHGLRLRHDAAAHQH